MHEEEDYLVENTSTLGSSRRHFLSLAIIVGLSVDSNRWYLRISSNKCGSVGFQRFMDECQKRMGVVW